MDAGQVVHVRGGGWRRVVVPRDRRIVSVLLVARGGK